jgi:hypothetical protein
MTFDDFGDHGHLRITYPSPPSMPPWQEDVFLVAQFGVYVQGPGTFNTTGHGEVQMDYMTFYPIGIDAQAGVLCARCAEACTFGPDICLPAFSPEVLNLQAPSGGVVGGEMTATLDWSGCPEPPWTVEHAWLQVAAERIDPWSFRLKVTASAEGLEPGEYTSWILAPHGSCQSCGLVRLTVSPTSDVPEPDDVRRSWGAIKVRFR